jgi:integrase
MASVFKKSRDRKRPGSSWYFSFVDALGVRRTEKGCSDKSATEALARTRESEAELRRRGVIDPQADKLAVAENRTVTEHLNDWRADLIARGDTAKHVNLFVGRTLRLLERAEVARLSELSAPRLQEALLALRNEGAALGTLNHYRCSVRAFGAWLTRNERLRSSPLGGLAGYNAKEDPRHERRTIGAEELRRLINEAHGGPFYQRISGPARGLVYQLAATTGLRYSELRSATPTSFDLEGPRPTITILAGYTKNGQTATLSLPVDLAQDLRLYLVARAVGIPAFDLPARGATMLRFDLERAGIPYRDESNRVFDFHSLRCECATLADQAGVSPRVVQRLMRHSTLELSGRYTRPRQHDLDSAVAALPALRPESPAPDAMKATGTDPGNPVARYPSATGGTRTSRKSYTLKDLMETGARNHNPRVGGSSPSAATQIEQCHPVTSGSRLPKLKGRRMNPREGFLGDLGAAG